MITIQPDTKISAIIKANVNAIEAIASINPHFNKLRNPILRKILASRVTVSEAAKIGKCSIECFAEKLRPLGFDLQCGKTCPLHDEQAADRALPFDIVLDVREDLAKGNDPFNKIMSFLAEINNGDTLLLVNSFVPFPLIRILERKNYTIQVLHLTEDIVHTYIQKPSNAIESTDIPDAGHPDFEALVEEYAGKMVVTDVRAMPMPQPMLHILEQLETLHSDKALFVYHKKVPMFLLPELKERGYLYAIKEDTGTILMLIYRNKHEAA